jgi:hypothetical protein
MRTHPFPIYRKRVNERSFYRIEADNAFTEVHRVGKRCVVHHIHAKTYPELVRIAELIAGEGGAVVECGHVEYEQWLAKC